MNELALARVIHLLGVVLWIGGVAMITTILLPTIAKMPSAAEKIEFFEHIENRFATQARLTTLITGLSGFYMVHTYLMPGAALPNYDSGGCMPWS